MLDQAIAKGHWNGGIFLMLSDEQYAKPKIISRSQWNTAMGK